MKFKSSQRKTPGGNINDFHIIAINVYYINKVLNIKAIRQMPGLSGQQGPILWDANESCRIF
jgi:hypothetical protein